MICPSRGRPKQADALATSFYRTRSSDAVRLHFALDQDDESAKHYPLTQGRYASHGAVDAMNQAFFKHVLPTGARYVGALCDEQRFITPHWDERVLAELDAMKGGLVYPNDLINPGTMPACPFMSVAIPKALGYFANPLMTTNYYDNVWKDVAADLGRLRYLDDVVVQHLSMPHREDNSQAIAMDRRSYLYWSEVRRPAEVALAKAALG